MPQRKKLSTTIGAGSYAYLQSMVKTGRAESVGKAVDKAVETARRLDSRATLERQTAAYFNGLPSKASAEETDLEDSLSSASQEMDFDQPALPGAASSGLRCWEAQQSATGSSWCRLIPET
jgi:hypothetical protein